MIKNIHDIADKRNSIGERFIICFRFIVIAVALFELGYLLIGGYITQIAQNPQNSFCEEWKAEWTSRAITADVEAYLEQKGVETDGRNIYMSTAVLPDDVEKHTYLYPNVVYSDVIFFIGENGTIEDELRYEFIPKNESEHRKTWTGIHRFVPLENEDSGKYITILQVAGDEGGAIADSEIYRGDKYGILGMYIRNNYVIAIFSIVLLVASVVVMITCLYLRFALKRHIELLYLSIGVFFATLWIIINSNFVDVIFTAWHVSYEMNYVSLLFIVIPFELYIDMVQKQRHRKGFMICGIVYVPIAIVCLILYWFNIMDLHESFMKIGWLMVAQLIYMIYTIVCDLVQNKMGEYKYVAIGYTAACLSGALQIVLYITAIFPFNAIYFSLGMLCLLGMSVTHSVKALFTMQMEKQRAVSANQAKSDFLASISHEIRTPINAVVGMNEMILRSTKEEETRNYALDVRSAVNHLLQLINQILDFSKIESGKMEIIQVKYALGSMINDIAHMIVIRADAKKLDFRVHVNPEIPAQLYGDNLRIRQIITNLLTNAVKYTHEGSVSLDVDGIYLDNEFYLCVRVKDTGIGIKEEDLHKLFEKFERIEEDRNRNIEGTGIGMNVVYRLLDMMGSHLDVQSEYGKGSSFSFMVKQGVVGLDKIGNIEERMKELRTEYEYEVPFEAPDAEILIVDDNYTNIKVVSFLLRDIRIHVDEASSGAEGLRKARKKKYDIIFMDHMMPGLNGIETLHRMKSDKDNPNIETPVIALTANAVTGAKEMYIKEGFASFLSKPINSNDLTKIMEKFIPESKKQPLNSARKYNSDISGLPKIEGVSWDTAIERLKDVNILVATVRDFCASIIWESEQLDMMYEQLPDEKAFEVYRIKIHSLKTTLATMGVQDLSDFARILEHSAANQRYDMIRNLHSSFTGECKRYKALLEPVITSEEPKEAITNYKSVTEFLALLRNAVKELDVDAADNIMNYLKGFEYNSDIKPYMQQLTVAVTNMDNDMAVKVIDAMEEILQELDS